MPSAADAGRICVLGSANFDLVVQARRAPAPGETLFGQVFRTDAGGKGLNQAVAAARAGATVRMLATVGDDEYGRQLRTRLQADHVDVSLVRTTDAATGVAMITVTPGGENAIIVVPGANADPTLTSEDRAAIAWSTHLVCQLERPVTLVAEALQFARDREVTTVLTPAPAAVSALPLLKWVDILFANAGEARLLAGTDDLRLAAIRLSRPSRTVVVTRGADGVIVAAHGVIIAELPAAPAIARDTTAAGDTFAGFAVAHLSRGETLDSALRFALAAAAISVTREGAAASMPNAAEVEARL